MNPMAYGAGDAAAAVTVSETAVRADAESSRQEERQAREQLAKAEATTKATAAADIAGASDASVTVENEIEDVGIKKKIKAAPTGKQCTHVQKMLG